MKFTHVNLIARDWKRLARFYQEVFGCAPVPPKRSYTGEWLDRATGVHKASIEGVHLRLPGHGDQGPTLEIFGYGDMPDHPEIRPNTPGFSHIALAVEDVETVVAAMLARGGKPVGILTEREVPGVGRLVFQYVADPEGNIVEVQNIKKK
jgi:predicted enzyme related to lactoylglutathione lyase